MRPRPARRPTPVPRTPPRRLPKPPRPAVLAIVAVLLLGWFSTAVSNPDTWWHLETGRYVCQTHHLPSPDPFAFTTAAAKPAYPGEQIVRRFNLTHEWLAQTISRKPTANRHRGFFATGRRESRAAELPPAEGNRRSLQRSRRRPLSLFRDACPG